MKLQFLSENLILFCMSITVQENYKDISTDKCRWFLILKVFVIFWVFTESIILMIWMRHGINSENFYSEWRKELRFKSAMIVTARVTCPSRAWELLWLGIQHLDDKTASRPPCYSVWEGTCPQMLPSCSLLYMFAVGLTILKLATWKIRSKFSPNFQYYETGCKPQSRMTDISGNTLGPF